MKPASRLVSVGFQLLIILPTLGWIAAEGIADPHSSGHPGALLFGALSIALIDLLPVPAEGNLQFSLSFPLQLAVALLYPSAAVAAAVTFVGSSDVRELKREISPLKAVFIRSQVALSVGAESLLFHAIATLHSPWYLVGLGVADAAMVGYALTVLLVAVYSHLTSGTRLNDILRQMHVGIIGEFLMTYMGLALFGVIIATSYLHEGLWAVGIFLPPLILARRMFFRTRSLELATAELRRRQAENEYQALHDALTGLPNRSLFHQHLAEALEASGGTLRVAVMIMDLDHFKEINDALGHHYGDLLLREVGPRV